MIQDDLENLAQRLLEEALEPIRLRRFDEFAKLIHPLELAKFKSLILSIGDKVFDELIAQELYNNFAAHLDRKSIVDASAEELFAAYCQFALFPHDDNSPVMSFDVDWPYCGVVMESPSVIHVLYRTLFWPTLATFEKFKGRWMMLLRNDCAKLSSYVRGSRLLAERKSVVQGLMAMHLESIRVIGWVDEKPWAHLVCWIEEALGDIRLDRYSVWPIEDNNPAYTILDQRAPLELELQCQYRNALSRRIDQLKSMMAAEDFLP